MKKMYLTILSAALILSLTACGDKPTQPEPIQTPPPQENTGSPDQPLTSVSNFTVADMTEEQAKYNEDYVSPLLLSGMLMRSWSPEDISAICPTNDGDNINPAMHLMYAYEDISGQDKMKELWDEYDSDLPAGKIDSLLTGRFTLTTDQIHQSLATIYDSETDTYKYEGGRGGGPIECGVIGVKQDGDYTDVQYQVLTSYVGMEGDKEAYSTMYQGVLRLKLNIGGELAYDSVEIEKIAKSAP